MPPPTPGDATLSCHSRRESVSLVRIPEGNPLLLLRLIGPPPCPHLTGSTPANSAHAPDSSPSPSPHSASSPPPAPAPPPPSAEYSSASAHPYPPSRSRNADPQ